jgi:hypothetical protein
MPPFYHLRRSSAVDRMSERERAGRDGWVLRLLRTQV